jgi:magnesium chelatase subunit D
VSVQHAARFLLVGTMNPEEGELRPQLLDRFGLTVEVTATRDPLERAEVVRRRLAYEADPDGFAQRFAAADADLAASIAAARERCPRSCSATARCRRSRPSAPPSTSTACAPTSSPPRPPSRSPPGPGRTEVTTEDVRTAARLALPHRRRRTPFEAPGLDEQQLDDALDSVPPAPDSGRRRRRRAARRGAPPRGARRTARTTVTGRTTARTRTPADAAPVGSRAQADAPAASGRPAFTPVALSVPGSTARRRVRSALADRGQGSGRLTGARLPAGRLSSLHLNRHAPGRRAAAGRPGPDRPGCGGPRGDLREAVREGREGNLVLFVVDASGSMAARSRMSAVKGRCCRCSPTPTSVVTRWRS